MLLLYFLLLGLRREMSFFWLDLVLTPVDWYFFHNLNPDICANWNMCNKTWTCLLSFNLRILASWCSSSVLYNLSFSRAHLRDLFYRVCNFFLTLWVAEGRKMSPNSKTGNIMFLYIMILLVIYPGWGGEQKNWAVVISRNLPVKRNASV